MVKELKDKAPYINTHGQMSSAAAAANGVPASGTRSTYDGKTDSLQAHHEIIVSIRNPLNIKILSHEPT